MKNTIKDIGGVVVDVIFTLIMINLIGYALLCLMAYSASADEVLTPDERIVALTILGEARGEKQLGMYGVACVIQERSIKRKLTPAQVCHQPWQFEIWNAGKGKIKKEKELWYLWDSPSKMYARKLARHLCGGDALVRSTVGNADHYCTLRTKPYWSYKKVKKDGKIIKVAIKPVAIIKNHKFYKLR
jgi:spore germination cell wall hydrolase CwlJ-like protein